MKVCTICQIEKELSEFYNYKATKDGKSYRCKACDNLARAKWKDENPERAARSVRGRQLKHRYCITLEEYETLFERQGRKCAVCEAEENYVRGSSREHHSFAVDHDHETGEVRGLLCNQCNRAIGMLGDSVEGLMKAVNYLETH